ncbi:MAG: GTP pyrophosphokinase [Romboutsia sp.]|nr:GTP pyrophosphokinase [Romboutsia sp.]
MNEYYLNKAIYLAWKLHDGQLDKAGKPYVLHPMYVMSCGKTLEEKIVACLHDVVEDTYFTLDMIREEGFREEIVTAIDLLTKRKDLNETYDEYLNRLIESKNKLAIQVKLYDLSHNMSDFRMKVLTPEKSKSLMEKYSKAYKILSEILD